VPTTLATEQLSLVVGCRIVTLLAEQPEGPAFTFIVAGHMIVGSCISLTVTVNVHEAVLPEASVAVAVTVVVPNWKVLPDGGTSVTVTGVVEQLSVALAE